MTTQPRMTAAELDAIGKVMREHQIVYFESGDTRVTLSANSTLPMPGAPVDPMRPIAPTNSPLDMQNLSTEDQELLFASSGGPPPDWPP